MVTEREGIELCPKSRLSSETTIGCWALTPRQVIAIIINKAAIDSEGILILSDTVYIPPTIEEIGEQLNQLLKN
jgi:hypothetical protein